MSTTLTNCGLCDIYISHLLRRAHAQRLVVEADLQSLHEQVDFRGGAAVQCVAHESGHEVCAVDSGHQLVLPSFNQFYVSTLLHTEHRIQNTEYRIYIGKQSSTDAQGAKRKSTKTSESCAHYDVPVDCC